MVYSFEHHAILRLRAQTAKFLPTCASQAWGKALAADAARMSSRIGIGKISELPDTDSVKHRVAVVIIGKLRALYADWILEQILLQLIQPLHADTFLYGSHSQHTWDEVAKAHHQGFKLLTITEVLARLQPVRHEFYSGKEYKNVTRWCRSPPNLYAQFWPFPRAFELVTKHENQIGFRYDWVVRTRPDITFHGHVALPLPHYALVQHPPTVFGQEYYHGCLICDHFLIATRNAAEALFTVERAFRECDDWWSEDYTWCWCCHGQCHENVACGRGRKMHRDDTECLIMRHLRRESVTVNASNLHAIQLWRLNVWHLNLINVARLTRDLGCPWE